MSNAKWEIENLTNLAYKEIKQNIINKQIAPGTRLVDSQLAEEYGISRTPVRDAIRMLAKEGLVVPKSKRGYVVFKATPKDVTEIFDVRLMIESTVMTKLLTEIAPNNITFYQKKFITIQQELLQHIQKNDPDEFQKYDEAFHEGLIKLANNQRLSTIYAENQNQTKAFRIFTSRNPQTIETANQMHVQIIDALVNMNLSNTLDALHQHLSICQKNVMSVLDDM